MRPAYKIPRSQSAPILSPTDSPAPAQTNMSTFSDNVAGTKRKLEQGSPLDVMEEGLTVVSQGQETVAE
jgi:hypothetical protein